MTKVPVSMRYLILSLTALGFTGCAAARRSEAKTAYEAAIAQCRANIPAVAGHYRDRASCISKAENDIMVPAFPDASDLLAEEASKRVQIGGKVDRGEISPDDADVLLNEYRSSLREQTGERDRENRAARPHVTSCFG